MCTTPWHGVTRGAAPLPASCSASFAVEALSSVKVRVTSLHRGTATPSCVAGTWVQVLAAVWAAVSRSAWPEDRTIWTAPMVPSANSSSRRVTVPSHPCCRARNGYSGFGWWAKRGAAPVASCGAAAAGWSPSACLVASSSKPVTGHAHEAITY